VVFHKATSRNVYQLHYFKRLRYYFESLLAYRTLQQSVQHSSFEFESFLDRNYTSV